MKIKLSPGKYIVAVSGGVDSMVLLHLLARQAKSLKPKAQSKKKENAVSFQPSASSFQLIVAYFNHGIRKDSIKDEQLARQTAKRYNLPIEVGQGKLGANASEDQARKARYDFLWAIKKKYKADGIVTAHHQDDLIETAILNMLRGTGRKGLTAIAQNPSISRPFLAIPKAGIIKYAKAHKITWREDESNKNLSYLRNYVRHKIVPKLSSEQRQQLLKNLERLHKVNVIIDQEIATISQELIKNNQLNRQKFTKLPHEIGLEVMMYWLRDNNIRDFDKKTIERLSTSVKTAKVGTKHEVNKDIKMVVSLKSSYLEL